MSEHLPRIRNDALTVLAELQKWKLPATRWDEVARTLDAMATGLELDDPDLLAEATIALEQAGPIRIKRIGEGAPRESAPPPVRERTGELIVRLTGRREDSA
jgi:hypothetical protein